MVLERVDGRDVAPQPAAGVAKLSRCTRCGHDSGLSDVRKTPRAPPSRTSAQPPSTPDGVSVGVVPLPHSSRIGRVRWAGGRGRGDRGAVVAVVGASGDDARGPVEVVDVFARYARGVPRFPALGPSERWVGRGGAFSALRLFSRLHAARARRRAPLVRMRARAGCVWRGMAGQSCPGVAGSAALGGLRRDDREPTVARGAGGSSWGSVAGSSSGAGLSVAMRSRVSRSSRTCARHAG